MDTIILIFSTLQDDHAAIVAEKIARNADSSKTPLILDTSEFSSLLSIEAEYNTKTKFRISFPNGNQLDLDDVHSFWWRRPQQVVPSAAVRDMPSREFIYSEWRTALYGIWSATSENRLWINDIMRDQKASHKPYQLAVAKKIGLQVPETLITNSPEKAMDFWKANDENVIFKSFLATEMAWGETRPLKKEHFALMDSVKLAPVIFQRYIAPAKDLRITVVGKRIFAAEAIPSKEYQYDWRLTSNTRWKTHALPQDIQENVQRLMQELGLEYGAIDMRLTEESDAVYYFLEINPAGQFLFIEKEAGLPIADALASHLVEGHRK